MRYGLVLLAMVAALFIAAGKADAQFNAKVTIKNNGKTAIQLFSSVQGGVRFLATLQPGAEGNLNTNLGDSFVIRDAVSRQVLRRFTVQQGNSSIQIGNLAAPPGNAKTSLILKNSTNADVRFFWRNFQGKEVPYGNVKAGASVKLQTFVGHQWVVRDAAGKELRRVTATKQPQTVAIAVAVQPPPRSTVLFITNQTATKLHVYWLSFQGKEISYGFIDPGKTMKRITGLNQSWIVRDARTQEQVQRITVTKQSQTEVVKAASPPAPTKVFVPNLLNASRNAAEQSLRNAGLIPKAIEGVEVKPGFRVGAVYVQNPQPANAVAKGTAVTFFYYKAKKKAVVNARINFSVDNQTANKVDLYWLNPQQKFQKFFSVAAGKKENVFAFDGNVLMFKDSVTDRVLRKETIRPNQQAVVFRAVAVTTISVPNLQNLTKTAAESLLAKQGLKSNGQQGKETGNAASVGKVYSQTVQANAKVNPGTVVSFFYYKAKAKKVVTNTRVNFSLDNRTQNQVDLYWLNGQRQWQKFFSVPAAQKKPISADIGHRLMFKDGVTAKELRQITVRANHPAEVLKAAAVAGVRVPNLAGQFKVDAEIALKDAGLTFRAVPGNITKSDNQLGVVYSQSQQAGSSVQRGTQVTFQYYRTTPPGGGQVKVPWVVNKSRWHAEKRLLRRGLIPKGIEGAPTQNAGYFFRVYQQSTDGDRLVGPGAEVAYTYHKTTVPIGPDDANSPDVIPNLIAYANADDSLDIAWMRRDEKAFISSYTGPNWQSANHRPIDNALNMLAGFTKDNAGNMYLATMRKEYAPKWRWDQKYTPNVAHILKIPAGARQAQLLADLNQERHTRRYPIVNPSITQSAFRNTARMAFGGGSLAVCFAQNLGAWNNVHETSNLIAVGLDGSNLYNSGGAQHCMGLHLVHDGNDFIMGQVYEDGLALSKLRRNGKTMQWSNHVVVFKNKYRTGGFLRFGGIASTKNGYLVVCAFGQGVLNHSNNVEWNGLRPAQPLYVVTAPRDFDNTPKDQRRDPPKTVVKRLLARPATDKSVFIRPKLVDLKNGKYIVIWEQRVYGGGNAYQNTQAAVIDGSGNIIRGPKAFNNARTHMSNDAFLLPRSRQAAWVSGDAVNRRIMLYTLDEALNLQSFALSLP